jgi:hypothetical protein
MTLKKEVSKDNLLHISMTLFLCVTWFKIARKTCCFLKLVSGWPDWANFRLIEKSLFGADCFNYISSPYVWATLSQWNNWVFILAKKCFWLHFGQVFHKIIWSPWFVCMQSREKCGTRDVLEPRATIRTTAEFTTMYLQHWSSML